MQEGAEIKLNVSPSTVTEKEKEKDTPRKNTSALAFTEKDIPDISSSLSIFTETEMNEQNMRKET